MIVTFYLYLFCFIICMLKPKNQEKVTFYLIILNHNGVHYNNNNMVLINTVLHY